MKSFTRISPAVLALSLAALTACAPSHSVRSEAAHRTPADTTVTPAQDLGEDVMGPLMKNLNALKKSVLDGAQNPQTLATLDAMRKLTQTGAATIPTTEKYKALAAADSAKALAQYQQAYAGLDAILADLTDIVAKKGSAACGADCAKDLTAIANARNDGHETFKDED